MDDVRGKKARKLLRDLQDSAPSNDCTKNKNSDLLESTSADDDDAPSESDDLPLAVPGFLLLSVGFLFPCFRPRRKDTSPPSVRPHQLINSGEYIRIIN